jgi:hypothetical protein
MIRKKYPEFLIFILFFSYTHSQSHLIRAEAQKYSVQQPTDDEMKKLWTCVTDSNAYAKTFTTNLSNIMNDLAANGIDGEAAQKLQGAIFATSVQITSFSFKIEIPAGTKIMKASYAIFTGIANNINGSIYINVVYSYVTANLFIKDPRSTLGCDHYSRISNPSRPPPTNDNCWEFEDRRGPLPPHPIRMCRFTKRGVSILYNCLGKAVQYGIMSVGCTRDYINYDEALVINANLAWKAYVKLMEKVNALPLSFLE